MKRNQRARTGTEPSLEAPVGLTPETALSESVSEVLTVYFQDARHLGNPDVDIKTQPRNLSRSTQSRLELEETPSNPE